MCKGHPGRQSRRALHNPESEVNFNSEIDPAAVKAGCDLVDRDYTSSIMDSDIPESPQAAMLARQHLEDARRRDEQDFHPTKLLSRPVSSGVDEPPKIFLFQAPSAQSAAPRQVFNPVPIYQESFSSQPPLAPEESDNAQDQLRGQLPVNSPGPATVEDASIDPVARRSRRPSPTAFLNQKVAHTDTPRVRQQVIEEQNNRTESRRQESHMNNTSENLATSGRSSRKASPQDESFDFRPLNHDQVPFTTDHCLLNSTEHASQEHRLEEENVDPRSTLTQLEANTDVQNTPQTSLEHILKTDTIFAPPREEHQVTTDVNYETVGASGEAQNFHGNDSVEESTFVEVTPEAPLEIEHHPNRPRQSRMKRQRTTSRKSSMAPGSKPSGVNKSQPRMKHKFPFLLQENQTEPAMSILNQPSAEDLLFLIMRRTRQKEQSEKALLARQQDLESDNERLHQENQDCRANLKEILAREQKSLSDLESNQVELHDCRTRFQKLKAWAKSMSKSYEELHKRSTELDAHRKSLTAAGAEMRKDINIAIMSIEELPKSVEAIKSKVSATREAVNSTMVVADAILKDKVAQLQTAQQENSQLKAHIGRLATDQKVANDTAIKEQQDITAQLKKLEEQIGKVRRVIDSDPMPLPGMDQCLKLVQTIHEKAQFSPEISTSLSNAIETLSEKVNVSKNVSVEARDATIEIKNAIRNEMTEEIKTVVDSIRSDFSWNEELSEVKKDNAYLEAKIRGSNVTERELRLSLKLAEDRAEKTQKSMETVLKSFGEGQSKSDSNLIQRNMQLSNTISQKTIQYGQLVVECTNQRNKVASLEESMSRKEAEVQKLMQQLINAEAADAQIRWDLNKAREQIKSQASDHDTILNRELSAKENEMNILRETEKSLSQQLSVAVKEIEVLKATQTQQHETLESALKEHETLSTRVVEAENEVVHLKNEMRDLPQLRKEAARVVLLLSDIKTKDQQITRLSTSHSHAAAKTATLDSEVASLKNKLEGSVGQIQKLRTANQKINILEEKNRNGSAEVAELKTKVAQIQSVAHRVKELEEDLDAKAKELESSENQLTSLKQTADQDRERALEVGTMRVQLNKATAEITELRRSNVSLQDRLTNTTTEVRELKESNTSLQRKLTNAEIVSEQLRILQTEIDGKVKAIEKLQTEKTALDEKVAELEMTTGKVTKLETAINNMRDAAEKKTTEFEALSSSIDVLNNSLVEARKEAARVQELQNDVQCKASVIHTLNSTIIKLNQDLESVQKTADEVKALENKIRQHDIVVSDLNSKIKSLNGKLSKAEETAAKVSKLEASIKTKDNHITDLSSKVMQSGYLRQQIVGLQSSAAEFQTRVDGLETELQAVKPIAERSKILQEAKNQKDIEIAELQTRLAEALETVNELAQLKEDYQNKDSEITTLSNRIIELEQDSPKIPESEWCTKENIPENFLSQYTILSLDECIVRNNGNQDEFRATDNDRHTQADRPSNRQPQLAPFQTGAPSRVSDAKSQFRSGLKERARLVRSSTLVSASDPRSTTSTNRIPDTQVEYPEADNTVAIKDSQEISTSHIPSSSSLSDIGDMFPSSESDGESMLEPRSHKSGKRSALQERRPYTGDDVANKTPSSSHGEQMLLEHIETHEEEKPLNTGLVKRSRVDMQTGETQRSTTRTTAKTLAPPIKGRMQPGAPQVMPGNRGKLVADPRLNKGGDLHTPLRQKTHSELNMVASSSPGAGRERYQPNSAAKRTIEPEETQSVGGGTAKKLKRMPANLEVKKPTKDFWMAPQREAASAGRPDLPSGSRKGSIIGADAQAPGKTSRTKSARKNSKNDRYSTRFSQQS